MSELREVQGWGRRTGEAWAAGLRLGIDAGPFMRAFAKFELSLWAGRAAASERHAAWFCALPWWRREVEILRIGLRGRP